MELAEARELYTKATAEFREAQRALGEAQARVRGSGKIIEGLLEMFPTLKHRVVAAAPLEHDPDDDEAMPTVRAQLETAFEQHAGEWLTVKQILELYPSLTTLADPEGAVRVAIRRMNGEIEKRPLDGRRLAFRRRPTLEESGQQRLEDAG